MAVQASRPGRTPLPESNGIELARLMSGYWYTQASLTPLAEGLRSDVPGSLRALASVRVAVPGRGCKGGEFDMTPRGLA